MNVNRALLFCKKQDVVLSVVVLLFKNKKGKKATTFSIFCSSVSMYSSLSCETAEMRRGFILWKLLHFLNVWLKRPTASLRNAYHLKAAKNYAWNLKQHQYAKYWFKTLDLQQPYGVGWCQPLCHHPDTRKTASRKPVGDITEGLSS